MHIRNNFFKKIINYYFNAFLSKNTLKHNRYHNLKYVINTFNIIDDIF
jgi:hypothetical protein